MIRRERQVYFSGAFCGVKYQLPRKRSTWRAFLRLLWTPIL